jgi:hypothetical protein
VLDYLCAVAYRDTRRIREVHAMPAESRWEIIHFCNVQD